ncbi:DUF2167 domain-containing protein [Endozoicomonas sp. G2_1]|uniref:DUF2167 domain-containing protein n=1 Tax=Endozoicomonas sp. G2_1 TaxID=2821091 RepID=UPI001ADBFEAD|nr:DUF2167 domain-containing protein [Endozoicomonas sp. G2_1]MBO9489463.1 DUF2167 domain-containing protein [Endozoicomonas sp. G2_1]
MKHYALLIALVLPISVQSIANQNQETQDASVSQQSLTEQEKYQQWATELWQSLQPTTGEVKLPGAVATLNVPDNFYYLSPEDTDKVLVEIWGNPPGQNTLGMLFPSGMTPFDAESWGVTIEYEQDGYISDKDADDINYSELLTQMKLDTQRSSEERVKQGYPAIELVGWAEQPYYDKDSHKLHWAKEVRFEGYEQNTLNYNIRVLGRRGVLVLNFIANMEQKPLIDSNLESVLALAEFDEGSRYSDFDPDVDKVAAYGLGALVAGKVLAKSGFFAAALIFLKKFGVFIVIGIAALAKKLFVRKASDN